ncbi:MAG: ABC transporter ATP-binding protein [Hyphomicrobiales bacterium]
MIRVEGLGFKYRHDNSWIFRNCSLEAQTGEVVAILGPNGCGKTTLLKTALGLYRPREGSVRSEGTFGYVPQNTEASLPFCVRDQVVMGRARHIKMFASPTRNDYHKSDTWLERLGLKQLADRPVTELSGGQRQLVLIARALVSDCRVMVLDEPASALDFRNRQTILKTLAHLARSHGITILFSTHMPQQAQFIADKVLVLRNADRHVFGPASRILSDKNLTTLYDIDMRSIKFEHDGSKNRVIFPFYQ